MFKIHLESASPGRLSACNLIDPHMPREAVRLTQEWETVSCGACKRTSEWYAAKQRSRS